MGRVYIQSITEGGWFWMVRVQLGGRGHQSFLRNVCNNRSRAGSAFFILCATGMSFWVGGGCHTERFVFKWR